MTNSTRRPSSGKASKSTPTITPKKPSKDFPLWIHQGSGYWSKKVRGHVHYFGKVADDPKGQAALEQWLEQKDDLLAGREPRAKKDDELTIADLCNQFLAHKEQLRDNIQTAEWSLTPEEIKILDDASFVPRIYPNWFLASVGQDRLE